MIYGIIRWDFKKFHGFFRAVQFRTGAHVQDREGLPYITWTRTRWYDREAFKSLKNSVDPRAKAIYQL